MCRLFIAQLLREVGKSGACKHVDLTISCYIFIPPCDKAHWIKLSMAFTRSNGYSWLVVLVFFVTCNDISYMWRYWCAGGPKKLYLRSGSQRHRHFEWFFNKPRPSTETGPPFLRLFRETAPFSHLLRHAGDTEDLSHLKPRDPTGNRYIEH